MLKAFFLRLSFTQGFLLGQLTVAIFIGAFIKYFIFGDTPSPPHSASKHGGGHHRSVSITSSSSATSTSIYQPLPFSSALKPSPLRNNINPPRTPTSTILSKTYYDVRSHPPESLDWFNVLIAQTIAQFRSDALSDIAILSSLTSVLNGPSKPDFLADIKITEIGLGDDFPIFSNCRVHPVKVEDGDEDGGEEEGGRLQARMDVDLSDAITLGIETKILLNYPRPLTAVLPIALSVSVVRFSGTLAISFLPGTSNSPVSTTPPTPLSPQSPTDPLPKRASKTKLSFSFLPNYSLQLSTRSLIGSRSRLQDIPKIAQLVEARLRLWFEERCVQPRMQQVAVPNLWPRMKNVVEEEGVQKEGGLSLGDEVRREVEEERERELERERQREGLRRRGAGEPSGLETVREEAGGYERMGLPGPIPGMMVS